MFFQTEISLLFFYETFLANMQKALIWFQQKKPPIHMRGF